MRLAFHPTLVRGPRLGLRERAALAVACGYGALDCGYQELTPENAEALAAAGLTLGLVGGIVGGAPMAPAEEFDRGLEGLAARAQAAAAQGARVTGMVLPNRSALGPRETHALVVERLRRVGGVLGEAGLALAVEFLGVRTLRPELPFPFCQEYAEFLALLEASGCANVGLLLDSYHWHAAGATRAEVAATPPHRILHLHINDCKPLPLGEIQDADRLIPGEGVIDLAGWFGAVAATGFTGCVAPEVLGPRLQGLTTEEAATACRAGALRALEAAGVPVG